ncbi:MAG: DUF2490 domain-containing protein [Cyclobacteriaceae bacterium]
MKKLLFVLFITCPLFAHSQDSQLGNWLMYFGNKSLSPGWNWHHEVQYRNYNAIGDLEQLLLRTGIGYNLSENNNNLLLGYGYILSQNYLDNSDEKIDVNEHRIYQQFITRQKFSRFSLQHRYRFEQRFVEDAFRLRFRYFLSINVALSNPEMADNTVYLSAYNEIFLNTEESNVFDRNRLYGGLGYRASSKLRFELGYMNQSLASSKRDQLNMVCFFSF